MQYDFLIPGMPVSPSDKEQYDAWALRIRMFAKTNIHPNSPAEDPIMLQIQFGVPQVVENLLILIPSVLINLKGIVYNDERVIHQLEAGYLISELPGTAISLKFLL